MPVLSVSMILRALYWVGFLLALTGLALRFWMNQPQAGLVLAITGVGLVLAARVNAAIRRR